MPILVIWEPLCMWQRALATLKLYVCYFGTMPTLTPGAPATLTGCHCTLQRGKDMRISFNSSWIIVLRSTRKRRSITHPSVLHHTMAIWTSYDCYLGTERTCTSGAVRAGLHSRLSQIIDMSRSRSCC